MRGLFVQVDITHLYAMPAYTAGNGVDLNDNQTQTSRNLKFI